MWRDKFSLKVMADTVLYIPLLYIETAPRRYINIYSHKKSF